MVISSEIEYQLKQALKYFSLKVIQNILMRKIKEYLETRQRLFHLRIDGQEIQWQNHFIRVKKLQIN